MINEVNYSRQNFGLIQHDTEIVPLLNYLKLKNVQSFVEIGTHKGGSFYLFSKICNGIKVSVDSCDGAFGGIGIDASLKRNSELSSMFENAHFIEGDTKSANTLIKLDELLNNKKVDFLFIDGDHSYEGVKSDYYNYKRFVKPGGFIGFHDIIETDFHKNFNPPCRVDLFWKEVEGDKMEIICEPSLRVWDGGGIGIIKTALV